MPKPLPTSTAELWQSRAVATWGSSDMCPKTGVVVDAARTNRQGTAQGRQNMEVVPYRPTPSCSHTLTPVGSGTAGARKQVAFREPVRWC